MITRLLNSLCLWRESGDARLVIGRFCNTMAETLFDKVGTAERMYRTHSRNFPMQLHVQHEQASSSMTVGWYLPSS